MILPAGVLVAPASLEHGESRARGIERRCIVRLFKGKPDGAWGDKWNFVDENNVVVGYDAEQSCCESAGYFFTHSVPKLATTGEAEINVDDDVLLPYRFDPEWFRTLPNATDYADDNTINEGGAVAFKLTAADKPDLYLVLYNAHNGYYGHGFTVTIGGVQTREDTL